MAFVTWLKQSPFATPWFDVILFGVLLFEVLPFFLRARAARYGFTSASLVCQGGLLISCLLLGATLTETLIVLALVAVISAASALLEYRLFDRETTIAERKAKAEESERIALARAEEFVLPKKTEEASAAIEEGGDNAQ